MTERRGLYGTHRTWGQLTELLRQALAERETLTPTTATHVTSRGPTARAEEPRGQHTQLTRLRRGPLECGPGKGSF